MLWTIPHIKTAVNVLKRDSDGVFPGKKQKLFEMFNEIKPCHGDTICKYNDLNCKINGVLRGCIFVFCSIYVSCVLCYCTIPNFVIK